jgi:hypothetical protein
LLKMPSAMCFELIKIIRPEAPGITLIIFISALSGLLIVVMSVIMLKKLLNAMF